MIFLMGYVVIINRANNCFKPLISSVFTTVASRLKSEQKENSNNVIILLVWVFLRNQVGESSMQGIQAAWSTPIHHLK